MLALRLIHDRGSIVVRLDRAEILVGTGPDAQVRLEGLPGPPRTLRVLTEGGESRLLLPGEAARRLAPGERIALDGLRLEVFDPAGGAGTDAPRFGGYDDDLAALAPGPVFELAGTGSAEARLPSETGAGPAGAGPAPPAAAATTAASPAHPLASAAAPPSRAPEPPSPDARPAPTPEPAPTGVGAAADAASAPPRLSPAVFPDPDFATALVEGLRRSPFWLVSLALHAVILILLSIVLAPDPDRPAAGPPAMAALAPVGDEAPADQSREEDPLEELPKPRLAPAHPMPAETDNEPQPAPPDAALPWSDELPDPLAAEPPAPLDIGLQPSPHSAMRRVRPARPPVPAADLARAFGTAGAKEGNKDAARLVRDMLARGGRRGKGSTLEEVGPNDILVVTGAFDQIQQVLALLGLPHTIKAPHEIGRGSETSLDEYKVVFWNCSERLDDKSEERMSRSLRRFVSRGGYLFTTDWSVLSVLEPAFPGLLQTRGRQAHLPEMVLDIQPARGAAAHPLLDGVFLPGVQGRWWFEQASFDVDVLKPARVDVLIEAPAMFDVYRRSPVVAATFTHGRGRVLHAVGHYFQEQGNVAGTIAAHRLALNFVLMRLDQDK